MSCVVPQKAVDRLEFYERHIPGWTTEAVGIGLVAGDVTALGTKATTARASYEAQKTAQDAAQAATLTWQNDLAALSRAGSECIKKIRVKAGSAGTSVYALAEIPAPATPSPAPAPGKPTDLVVSLDSSGALALKWKCPNPAGVSGTMYQLRRRIGAAMEFEYIGGTGSKKFLDNKIPAGSTQVTYQIQAVRSTAVGLSAEFNVNFGVSSSGGATASVVETSPTRIAA